jgi:hypothetical protein
VDSLEGGNTENCDIIGKPAEKWLAYSTLKSTVSGLFVRIFSRESLIKCLAPVLYDLATSSKQHPSSGLPGIVSAA